MQFLLINTCGVEGSVALADTSTASQMIAVSALPGRSSSERLVPAVRALLEGEAWTLHELSAIVVVNGPGSFTGIRVGLSAAKGLSEASGVPLIAVSRLAVLASVAGAENGECVHAALDAGRGEFYYGNYVGTHYSSEALLTLDELRIAVGDDELVVCEAPLVETLVAWRLRVVAEPAAADALKIAINRAARSDFDEAAQVDANYLRRTDLQLFARPVAR